LTLTVIGGAVPVAVRDNPAPNSKPMVVMDVSPSRVSAKVAVIENPIPVEPTRPNPPDRRDSILPGGAGCSSNANPATPPIT